MFLQMTRTLYLLVATCLVACGPPAQQAPVRQPNLSTPPESIPNTPDGETGAETPVPPSPVLDAAELHAWDGPHDSINSWCLTQEASGNVKGKCELLSNPVRNYEARAPYREVRMIRTPATRTSPAGDVMLRWAAVRLDAGWFISEILFRFIVTDERKVFARAHIDLGATVAVDGERSVLLLDVNKRMERRMDTGNTHTSVIHCHVSSAGELLCTAAKSAPACANSVDPLCGI
jgi:hypothetical protein